MNERKCTIEARFEKGRLVWDITNYGYSGNFSLDELPANHDDMEKYLLKNLTRCLLLTAA